MCCLAMIVSANMSIYLKRLRQYTYKHRGIVVVLLSICLIYILFTVLGYKSSYYKTLDLQVFPDTLYYSAPAWNFVHGYSFDMAIRDAVFIPRFVTPLYPILLIPFFFIFSLQGFIVLNTLLLLTSIVFIGLALYNNKKLHLTSLQIFSLLLLYICLPVVIKIPLQLMAEAPTIAAMSLLVYILCRRIDTTRTLLPALIIGWLMYFIKQSNIFIFFPIVLLYLWHEYFVLKRKGFAPMAIVICISVVSAVFSYAYGIVTYDTLVNPDRKESIFLVSTFISHFEFYVKTLFGAITQNEFINSLMPLPLRWETARIVSPLIGILALFGVVRNYRNRIIMYLTVIACAYVIGMSFFGSTDHRYAYVLLPVLWVFCAFGLASLSNKMQAKNIFILVLVALILFVPILSHDKTASTIVYLRDILTRQQADYDFYRTIKTMNKYTEKGSSKKIYLLTFLPEFYTQYFINDKYTVLPISTEQEFFWDSRTKMWHQYNLPTDYVSYLRERLSAGDELYITDTHGRKQYDWKILFDGVTRDFQLRKIVSISKNGYAIYKIMLKQ